jgi:replication-associated recombination protein RarA
VAAKDAFHFVGLPEGKIPLAQAVTYLATAPKSNASYKAMLAATEDAARAWGLTRAPASAQCPYAIDAKTRLRKELQICPQLS